MSAAISSVVNPQSQSARQSARQTRTNPSRTSKTLGRSSFAYGHGSMSDAPPTPTVPHGFYPALTHFTDAITALPREFRRHNSLLKEVDAKAWALEENLLQLLKVSSETQAVQHPPNPAPIVAGVIRDDIMPQNPSQPPESPESKNRRLLFDRVRHTLSDLMMTADEKNHVISNANDELDRQVARLDTVFPFIAGEISDESRLGSLTHWAYSNRNTATKTTTNERPRREVAAAKELAEAEAFSRSEARREAVLARKHRRGHADSEFDDTRSSSRRGHGSKARGSAATGEHATTDNTVSGSTAATKRRKVDRPTPAESGTPMERTASGAGSTAGGAGSKDAQDPAKKRSRAPNSGTAAARKRNTTGITAAESPILAPSPVIGTFNAPRKTSPVSTTSRPQSSRAQQNGAHSGNGRNRPSSATSNRVTDNKGIEGKPISRDTPHNTEPGVPGVLGGAGVDAQRREPESEVGNGASSRMPVPGTKREDSDRPAESVETGESPAPPQSNSGSKGRSSKTSTPVLQSYEPAQPRVRPTRSTNPAPATSAKRSHKKNGGAPVMPPPPEEEEEESMHEGDDEDEEGEPRYCYCNEVSFGEMVACDNDACPREWFHLSCVGMTKPPGKNVKWYCNECKDSMRRSRSGR
ncbi:putative PHD finger domain protein (Ing1) [Aspergillus glaucus CBS 516.65]|uniref:Chromatin modification-related protein n=1 Tax=Aspergillus glaucus CBS 516.65 TaxID=1160497 RepID=A0A1L9VE43_ASPGL|nr:hypothetical protein ASPGLDRAFT_49630 [Aspergillus glaucus CBS 516.65]OJJ82221.1 hypothetical protein ASPGLDRAFT_49630 [Aspergillus glaucus CBS 516.65]